MKNIIILVIIFTLTACISTPIKPTQSDRLSADYGIYPTNYKELIYTYWSQRLIDPYSAQYEFSPPFKARTEKVHLMHNITPEYVYVVTLIINAKNRMGGYTGRKKYYMFIRDGNISLLAERTSFWQPWSR